MLLHLILFSLHIVRIVYVFRVFVILTQCNNLIAENKIITTSDSFHVKIFAAVMPPHLTFTTAKVKIKLLSYFFPNSHGCIVNYVSMEHSDVNVKFMHTNTPARNSFGSMIMNMSTGFPWIIWFVGSNLPPLVAQLNTIHLMKLTLFNFYDTFKLAIFFFITLLLHI